MYEEIRLRINQQRIYRDARQYDECNLLHLQPPSRHAQIQEYIRDDTGQLISPPQ